MNDDPEYLNEYYLREETKDYKRSTSRMPNEIDFTFDAKFSGINITDDDMRQIKEAFQKFNLEPDTLRPPVLRDAFKKFGMDKQNPALYSMMCWISDANEFSGTEGMTFDEFITYICYFFTRKTHEEGLMYMFQLFDPERKGYLTR